MTDPPEYTTPEDDYDWRDFYVPEDPDEEDDVDKYGAFTDI